MHELGLVFQVIKTVEKIAEENHLKQVESVTLEVDEVSSVIPEYLADCWTWACAKSDLMRGAQLKFEMISAVSHCDKCGQDYATLENGKVCPHCGSLETVLLSGNEFNIKEMVAG